MDSYSSLHLLDMAHQKLEWERAMYTHTVQRALRDARIFQVNTKTFMRKCSLIHIQIKIRNKIARWETLNMRTAEEAIALARYEGKGLRTLALMAAPSIRGQT